MELVVFVFVVVLVMILGAYYGLVVRSEQALMGRLQPRRQTAKRFRDLLKIRDRQSALDPINNLLERMAPLTLPVRTLLLQAGVRITVSVFVLLSLCLGLASYLLLDRLTGMFLAGLLAGVIATAIFRKMGTPKTSYPHGRRLTALFAAMSKDPTPPEVVAEQVHQIIEGDSWQLRYPVGPHAPIALAWRARTSDEEWVAMLAGSDADWVARVKQEFGIDLVL